MWNFEAVFWFCALAGTGMLVIQFLLSLAGTDHDADLIEDGKFKWMTKQAATGFIMMLGWAGLTCREQFHLSMVLTLLISLGAASLSAFITVLIFNLAKKAHSSGTVFKIEEAVGKEAIVYHRIPKSGTGKISVSLHNFTHEIDAISPYEEEIASFTQVQIIKQADDKTVIVVPLK